MSARLAKLPVDLPPLSAEEEAELEDDEAGDSVGALSGGGYSGLGPPAMCALLRAMFPYYLA